MTWRTHAARVIVGTLDALPGDADRVTVERALRDAYPYGERRHHPYKIWLDEKRRQCRARFPALYGNPTPRPLSHGRNALAVRRRTEAQTPPLFP